MAHKTFHRYTVRAKQGSDQMARDGAQQKAPKSAGATLRRYNAQQLITVNQIFFLLLVKKSGIKHAIKYSDETIHSRSCWYNRLTLYFAECCCCWPKNREENNAC